MLNASSGGGDWERPLASLREGIEKLRTFAMNEADQAKQTSLNLKIQELEIRASSYLKVIKEQGRS